MIRRDYIDSAVALGRADPLGNPHRLLELARRRHRHPRHPRRLLHRPELEILQTVAPVGCINMPHIGRPALQLTGQRFGSLVVRQRVQSPTTRSRWLCDCDCGRTTIVDGTNLNRPHCTVSCGCVRAKGCAPRHGQTDSPEHNTWAAMMARCYTRTNSGYRRYGAVGITVCERWHSFEHFRDDMGKRPFPKASLDRIDGRGHYEPGNCRWATSSQQIVNRCNMPALWTLNGSRITIGEIAHHLAIERHALTRLWNP